MKWILGVVLLLVSSPVFAQTLVSKSAVGAQNTTTVSSAAFSATAFDTIAAICFDDTSGVTQSVSDSQGNTFTALPRYIDAPWSGEWFYAKAKTTGTDTVKCTYSGTAKFVAVFAVDVKGAASVVTVANAFGSSSVPNTTGTTTVANELLVAANLVSAHVTSSSGTNFITDGYGNGLATLTVALPGSATISFAPSNTSWMQQMIGFTSSGVVVTTPPVVTVALPPYSGTVTLTAVATDTNSTIASVQFLLDTVVLSPALTASPYTYAWNTLNTTNGTHTIAATAINAAGQSTTSAAVTVTVLNTTPPPPPPALTATSPLILTPATQNIAYSYSIPSGSGLTGGVPPYSYVISTGALPAGLTLNATSGLISGTPTGTGTSSFSIIVTDSSGETVKFKIENLEATKP
jgi:hypothetical protein